MKGVINFNWYSDEDILNEDHIETLKLSAIERTSEMVKEDYTSGELYTVVEGVHYNGFWDISFCD